MPVLTCYDGMRHLLRHAKGLSDLSRKMANHCSVYSCISKPVFQVSVYSVKHGLYQMFGTVHRYFA